MHNLHKKTKEKLVYLHLIIYKRVQIPTEGILSRTLHPSLQIGQAV